MRVLLFFLLTWFVAPLRAVERTEPVLKPNDIVALVGGQDLVVTSELGYLEAMLQSGLPDFHLKLRSLAWEGDTVFEQRRDLNYPTLEAQLDKMGATVVVTQFGLLESISGREKVPEFEVAYEKLIGRLSGGGKRRVLLVSPHEWLVGVLPKEELDRRREATREMGIALEMLAKKTKATLLVGSVSDFWLQSHIRTKMHLSAEEQKKFALLLFSDFVETVPGKERAFLENLPADAPIEKLRQLVVEKNRLWFNYTRPQNWAFLAGDRTTQPSSRDHLDSKKRWFPEELEKFVPLIESKEKEIWEVAAKFK